MSNSNSKKISNEEIEKRIPYIEGRLFRRNYIYVIVKCPYCGKKHYHGVSEGMFGGYSHRVEHCAAGTDDGNRYGYCITLPLADIKLLAKAQRNNFHGTFPIAFLKNIDYAKDFIAKLNGAKSKKGI
jgi:hypothetical protein